MSLSSFENVRDEPRSALASAGACRASCVLHSPDDVEAHGRDPRTGGLVGLLFGLHEDG